MQKKQGRMRGIKSDMEGAAFLDSIVSKKAFQAERATKGWDSEARVWNGMNRSKSRGKEMSSETHVGDPGGFSRPVLLKL